jgi:hypothetical protein
MRRSGAARKDATSSQRHLVYLLARHIGGTRLDRRHR